jgi:predicted  nucleic acid-binding Zn-ribbon protein
VRVPRLAAQRLAPLDPPARSHPAFLLRADPAGTAFSQRLANAAREFASLQAVERELKQEEQRFSAHIQSLRQSLEGTSKSLSVAHTKRTRLAKELAACDEEISRLETLKAETTNKIHTITSQQTSQRERKLQQFDPGGGGGGGGLGGASSAPAARRPPSERRRVEPRQRAARLARRQC